MRRSPTYVISLVYDFVQKNGHTYNGYKEGSKYPRPPLMFQGLNSSVLTCL
jgi:hypothetical protein